MAGIDSPARLPRPAFRTSRLLDFASEKELTAQIGHPPSDWPLVIVKELIDNALDACEEAGIALEITVCVDENGITVGDNGCRPRWWRVFSTSASASAPAKPMSHRIAARKAMP